MFFPTKMAKSGVKNITIKIFWNSKFYIVVKFQLDYLKK